jgi:hypothetical protein
MKPLYSSLMAEQRAGKNSAGKNVIKRTEGGATRVPSPKLFCLLGSETMSLELSGFTGLEERKELFRGAGKHTSIGNTALGRA